MGVAVALALAVVVVAALAMGVGVVVLLLMALAAAAAYEWRYAQRLPASTPRLPHSSTSTRELQPLYPCTRTARESYSKRRLTAPAACSVAAAAAQQLHRYCSVPSRVT